MAKEKTEVEARCEELAKELSKSSREHIRLEEKVVKLKATLQLAAATAPDGGGGTSASSASAPENQHGSSRLSAAEAQFTPQQMAIQIRNLKHKLACPVCKDREKKCILKRCNHMFCRQCVDENIKVYAYWRNYFVTSCQHLIDFFFLQPNFCYSFTFVRIAAGSALLVAYPLERMMWEMYGSSYHTKCSFFF
mmetsp:Transcript_38779/g.90174  ORF Transcript_38779/g.90174 Transcript_38779/m.90174 type:complete len:193 (+) Transcript_38779:3710-4288(+)